MERESILLAFVVGLLVAEVSYRIDLADLIYSGTSKLPSLQPAHVPVLAFLKTPLSDLLLMVFFGVVYLGCKLLPRSGQPRPHRWKIFSFGEAIAAAGSLMVITLAMRIHFQLLAQLETGLTMTFVQLSPQMFSGRDYLELFTMSDLIYVATPLLAFILALACAGLVRAIYKPVGVLLVVLIVAAQFLPGKTGLPPQIALNPLVYLADDAIYTEIYNSIKPLNYATRPDSPGETQLHSIRLVDAAFVNPNPTPAAPACLQTVTSDGKPWNILIFVLESTGADYAFDTNYCNQVPMPFLQKISREGLYLANHYTTANISANAAFSIFTGLYPAPAHRILSMNTDQMIPTFNRYLGSGYDYFLVHPTSPSFWFPESLFLNNKLTELDSLENMPPGTRSDLTFMARNEFDCFDFLQSRLDRAHEPFLGVYWSFIPHYPYSDYGSDFRICPDLKNSRDRYYNNLRTLDTEIRLIYEHLQATGMADRTLFVFVGDHGEAFGQHKGIWAHTTGIYDEMFRVPAIIWQPKLVQPQVIKFPTSHVDIVPTLFDLLGIPYDSSRLQGYSVLRGLPNRKYIFTMDGYADHVSAISQDMKKISLCFKEDEATAFDLNRDPGEKIPLNEYDFSEQITAILKFRNFQLKMIHDYNQALFDGFRYPPRDYIPPVSHN